MEKTLILLKHDSISRGLIGKIITRFEDIGLKIIAMKMILPDENLAKNHYFLDEEWAKAVFEKTKVSYEKDKKTFPKRLMANPSFLSSSGLGLASVKRMSKKTRRGLYLARISSKTA